MNTNSNYRTPSALRSQSIIDKLHAEDERLAQNAVDKVQHTPQQQAWLAIEQALAERDKLKAINAELIDTLQEYITCGQYAGSNLELYTKALHVIMKAKATQ